MKAATRGIRVIQTGTASHYGSILAGLHSQAMVHYARSPEYIELSKGYEQRVLDWQQRLPETRVPSAFELTPSQMYNSLAIAHAFRQQPDASELFAAGYQATGYTTKERVGFRKLLRLNQAWAEAPRDPQRALEIACAVMRSFGRGAAPADPIYRDRAMRTLRAVPESVPPQWTAELRHLIGHPHR